ncbi:hypothetical protein MNBD_GAMMA25-915 [hydrothermal vent metagenome]|uniref:Long-chain fatty acid transport protein n=1 Tax=hydrothermal vent metagenome TaxID=652676 RepID=A0A3B1ARY0_9ZZZZ
MKKTTSIRSKFQPSQLAALTAGLLISLPAIQVQASGFRVPEISTTGMGLSNALVANKDEVGAIAYNPAIMAFHEGHTFQIGATAIGYDLSVNPTGGSQTDSTAKDIFLIPNMFLSAQTSENITFGLAMNSPFGLETRWPKDTFPAFGGSGLEPEHSKINMVNVNPSIAIKLGKKTSVAMGIMFYDVNSLVFNTQSIDINGSGSGYGWNLAMLHTTKRVDFGLSYKSSVNTNLKGTVASNLLGGNPARANLEFPNMLQIGLLYRINDKFNVEFDIERTGWNVFDQIVIEYDNAALGTRTITSTNNWDNATAYRLGATYQMSDKTKLRFGYSYDETPQPEVTFSPRVPDNNRQLFSIGVGHDFGGWMLDAAYMHVVVDDRTVAATTFYNGTYESSVDLLGVGLSTTF